MAHRHLLFRTEAQEKLLRGANALADAVRLTIGPKAKCVLIQKKWGRPIICDDGVTIAKECELKDPEENLGAQVVREAAEKTGDAVGDGTSTATILAYAIYSEGLRNIAAGASAVDLKRGLDRGLRVAVDSIKSMSRPVSNRRERAQVASISAHNDSQLGELVADAMEKVGSEGVVSVEEAKGTEISLEVVEGMQFDRGYLSPYFVTNVEKMQAILEDPLILLYGKKISSAKDLVPLLEQTVKAGKPLLVIAEDVDGEALATLVVNKLRGILMCAAAKAPGYGDRRKATMEDLAVLTKGQYLAQELGVQLEAVQLKDLGRAQRVVLDKDTTTIIGGSGGKEAIQARCSDLRRQLERTTSDYDRDKLEERLAKLAGGVAVIRVGAPSEAELKSRKEALEDAISATKAAVAEGIVPGGGLSLLRAIEAVGREEANCEGDERTGLRIFRKALEAPAWQIAENSGADGGSVVEKMREGTGNFGFDAAQEKYVDLVAAGIVDPTKVVRLALENAVSVAGTLLRTEATMTEIPEDKTPAAHGEDFEG
jgi:chaperonin GroEL